MPRLGEYPDDDRGEVRELEREGIHAVCGAAKECGHHEGIRNVDYPPHDRGRHEGNAVAYHGFCQYLVVSEWAVLLIQLRRQGKEDDGAEIAEGNGQDVSDNAEVENAEEKQIQKYYGDRCDNSVDGKQFDMSPGTDIDGADSFYASGGNVHVNEPPVFCQHVDESYKWDCRRE